MNKTIENAGKQPFVEKNVMPEKLDIAKEQFYDLIACIESKIDVMREEIIDTNKKIEHESEQTCVRMNDITQKQLHGVVTRLEDKINVLESKFDEQTETKKQQFNDMEMIENRSKQAFVKIDVTEQMYNAITSLEDKINNLQTSCDEHIESTKQHIIELNKRVEIGSENIPYVLTSRRERIDIESIEIEPTNKTRSICNFIKGLVESSTLHGLPRLTVKGKIWKTFWGILLIVALGVSVLQIGGLFGSYFQYPVYVDVIFHSTIPTFPQITICMHHPYNRSAVIRHLSLENITNVDIDNDWKTMTWISNLPEQERIQLGYEASEVLRVYISHTEGSGFVEMAPSLVSDRDSGNCYVIIPPMKTKTVFVYLNANVNTSLDHPLYKEQIVYAFFNEPGLDPFYSEKYQTIPFKPNTHTKATFRLDVYNRLNGVYGGCQDDEELFQQRTGYNYTKKLCLIECGLKNAQMKCGCVNHDIIKQYRFKVPEQLSAIRSCSNVEWRCFYEELSTLTNCHCNEKCIQSVYTAQKAVVDMLDMDVDYACWEFNVTCTDIERAHRKFALFSLESAESRYKEFKQQPLYPPSRFMSDLGGTLGFYLGASVLTLFELIHMLSGLIWFLFKQRTTE